jgi:hypothetical protein
VDAKKEKALSFLFMQKKAHLGAPFFFVFASQPAL